ncbi:MAG: hypothetical protein V4674_03940 [Patescibacteria group bacterium]
MKMSLRSCAALFLSALFLLGPSLALALEPNAPLSGAPVNLQAPCGNRAGGTGETRECTVADFINFVGSIVQFLIFQISIPLAVLAFVVLGFRLVVSQNKPTVYAETKKYLMDLVLGIFLVVSAYAIVSFIYSFVAEPYRIFFR